MLDWACREEGKDDDEEDKEEEGRCELLFIGTASALEVKMGGDHKR